MASGDFNHFPELSQQLSKVAGQLVRKAALDIAAHAASRAPVKSGFLKSSIYIATSANAGGDSTYGQGVSGKGELLPALPPPEVSDDGASAVIGVGADYGVYVELGTRHSPAQPYLLPAAESVRPSFEAAFERLEEKLKG